MIIITCTEYQAADSQEHGLYFFQQLQAASPHILYYIQWSLTHDNTALPIELQGTLIKEEKFPFDLPQVNAVLTLLQALMQGLSPHQSHQTTQLQRYLQPEREITCCLLNPLFFLISHICHAFFCMSLKGTWKSMGNFPSNTQTWQNVCYLIKHLT